MSRAPGVLGLDLALTKCGIARPDGTTRTWTTKLRDVERLYVIRHMVRAEIGLLVSTGGSSSIRGTRRGLPVVDVVALEGYAHGRTNQAHQIGEAGGIVRLDLWEHGIPYLLFPPTQVKKYATGRGNANKDEVLASAIRRLDYQGASNDEADALWLRALGLATLGHPVVELPKSHLEVVQETKLYDADT